MPLDYLEYIIRDNNLDNAPVAFENGDCLLI